MRKLPKNAEYEKISEWLEIYHSTEDEHRKAHVKSLIVTNMIPVVKKIARTIARRATDPVEDMIQAGFIGLLKAIDKYSAEKNDNFRVYAGYFIIGEMKHFLRDKLNNIRVPRHIQELVYRINSFTKTLTMDELRDLTNKDVAIALNLSTKTIDYVLEVERRSSTLSLEGLYTSNDNNLGYEELLTDKEFNLAADIRDATLSLNEILPKLSTEERMIVDLYYNRGVTQKEIAKSLNITPMRVSRKLKNLTGLIYRLVGDTSIENFEEELNIALQEEFDAESDLDMDE